MIFVKYSKINNITIVSDFENFRQNINRIFSPLSLEYMNFNNCSSIESAINNIDKLNTDLIIINKAGYKEDELDLLTSYKGNVEILVIIDSYFKYDKLFKKFNEGIMTVRRPLTLNKFVEIIKVLLISIEKRKKSASERATDYKIIDYAKMLLIIKNKISEDDAHKYLEKHSMELRITLSKASTNIILDYLYEMENIKYEY